jgi:DNA repair protein RadC
MRINMYSVKLVKETGVNYSLEEKITSPQIARDIIEKVLELSSSPVEKFGIIALTTKNKVAGVHIIAIGGLSQAVIEAREIFQHAILNNAASIILFHNHPSGDPDPSKEDVVFSKKIEDAGKLLSIKVMDHVIIGESGRFASLKERGLI